MVYLVTFGCFTAFSWGVAYAPNYAALVIFRLLGERDLFSMVLPDSHPCVGQPGLVEQVH